MLHRLLDSVAKAHSVCQCGCPGGSHKRSGCTLCDCRAYARWSSDTATADALPDDLARTVA